MRVIYSSENKLHKISERNTNYQDGSAYMGTYLYSFTYSKDELTTFLKRALVHNSLANLPVKQFSILTTYTHTVADTFQEGEIHETNEEYFRRSPKIGFQTRWIKMTILYATGWMRGGFSSSGSAVTVPFLSTNFEEWGMNEKKMNINREIEGQRVKERERESERERRTEVIRDRD